MEKRTRRDVVKVGSTGLVASVAGCTSRDPEDIGRQNGSRANTTDGNSPERTASADGDHPEQAEFSTEELSQAKTLGEGVREAVAVIRGDTGSGGTAWFLDTGDLITNSHVVDGNESFEAWSVDGEKFTPELVGTSDYMNNPYHDVAVLETDFSPNNELSLGESDSVEKGQPVVQVGHPFGIGNWVVSIGRYVEEDHGDALLTSVPSLSGNSGAPLLTLDGSVVGITTGGVPRDRLGSETPEPVDLEVYEEFTDYKWATHDKTSVISRYVEQF